MSSQRASGRSLTFARQPRPMLPSVMLSTIVLRTQSDERLVVLAAGGSEAAFEAIVQRYRRDLLAYCTRLLLSDSRAEDAVQQALLAAWAALRGGTEVRRLKPWLYRLIHNHAMDALRRPGWDFVELSESLCGRDAPESDLERRMLMRETLAAVAALPDLQREAILRTAVEGDSYAAVADALGVSDSTLRGLIYRARASVRATVAAVAPPPLVMWAAGIGRRHAGAISWLSDNLMAGGGAGAGVGASAVVVKSAAVLASSAVILGGGLGTRGTPPGLGTVREHAKVHLTDVRTTAGEAQARTASVSTNPDTGTRQMAVFPDTSTGRAPSDADPGVYRRAGVGIQAPTSSPRAPMSPGRRSMTNPRAQRLDRTRRSRPLLADRSAPRRAGGQVDGIRQAPDSVMQGDAHPVSAEAAAGRLRHATGRAEVVVQTASDRPGGSAQLTSDADAMPLATSDSTSTSTSMGVSDASTASRAAGSATTAGPGAITPSLTQMSVGSVTDASPLRRARRP